MRCVKQFFKSLLRFFVDLPVHSDQWRLLRSSLVFRSFKTKVVASAGIVADQAFTTKTSRKRRLLLSQTEGYLRQTLQNISILVSSNSTHGNSFFQAWLNLRTRDSSYFFFFIVVEMFSSFDGDGLLLFSLRSI